MNPSHDDLRMSLGAYVLGALEPGEARDVEAHLAGCPACRAELASLETLPALLDAVPLERAEALAHDGGRAPEPAAAPGALLARVARRRRARTLAWAGALAAAAAGFFAAGVALGPAVGNGPGPAAQPAPSPSATTAPAATLTLTSDDGAHVDLALVRKAWGTQLDLTCRGMPEAGAFSVWVVAADGASQQAGSWSSAGYQGRAVLTGATSFQLASIRTIEIRDETQHTVASAAVS
ncbi:anti-sigma factor family protein [Sinomonas flava]|uniref:anti-sigma factor family protein n=1 Tax=Sinomonas flava TaxID=496857 RepID=UPI0039A582BC